MSSFSGRVGMPYLGLYPASKHALEAISDALRVELRPWGIEVALVEPASVATPIWDRSIAEANRGMTSMPLETVLLYKADLKALRTRIRRLIAHAMPAETVARAVVHALTARRPKTRYPLPLGTGLTIRLRRWLPDRLWDRLVKWPLG